MADDTKSIIADEQKLYKSVLADLKDILDTKRKVAKAEFESFDIAQKALDNLKDQNKISKDRYEAEINVLKAKTDILQKIKNGKTVEKSLTDEYLLQARALRGIEDAEDRISDNAEKVKKHWKDIDSQFGGIHGKLKEISGILRLAPEIIAVLIFLSIFKKIFDVFQQLDEAAADFRKSMGITRKASEEIETNARAMSISMMAIGVSAKDVYESIKAIADEFGSSQTYTTAIVKDMAMLSAQFGISTQTSAKFLKTMAMVSGSTASTQKDMLLIAQRMSAAAGVPLDSIMNDVAEASHDSYQFISRNPLELLKSAIQAKLLGTNLQASAKSSASLLNFTESVKNEMEASVLLGKSMNLQKARELAYHRDIAGLNREIVKLAKDANFEQLDPFQQDAVAKALGKSAGEIASMLESDREHNKVLNAMTREQRKQYDLLINIRQAQVKNYADLARDEIRTISNQKATAAISAAWSSIFARLGQTILPTIAKVLTTVAGILSTVADTVDDVETKIGSMSKWAGGFLKTLIAVGTIVVLIMGARGLGKLVGWATGGIGKAIGSLFGGVAEGVGKFGGSNVLKGALGIALLGVSLFIFAKALGAFANVKWSAVFIGIGALVLLGVIAGVMGALAEFIIPGAIAIGILGLALIPFAAAAWIASKALQNLANVPLGNIANGLLSLGLVSPAILAAGLALGIAAPGFIAFSLALRLIAGPAERVGKAMLDLGAGLKMTVESLAQLKSLSFFETISQLKNLSSTIKELSKVINDMPSIKVEKLKSISLPSSGVSGDKGTQQKGESTSDILGAIKDGIEGLRSDLKSGALTANVYIDSQKLDSAVGRRLAYTGALT